MTTPPKRRALGRGLGALLPTAGQNGAAAPATPAPGAAPAPHADADEGAARPRQFFTAAIEDIYPSPDQPRKRFAEAELEELAASIRAHGVIQPLVVRRRSQGGYHLIAGERRWRASQRAGLHEVPVVVQDVDPKEAFERALVENIQRADLNAIEEAEAYSRLVSEFGYSQDQVAERVGKDRSTVANSLRLLKLPQPVRGMVEDGRLSMGHARALLALDSTEQIEVVARTVAAKGLSVRRTEELVRKRTRGTEEPRAKAAAKSPAVRDLENRLMKRLGAQVSVSEDAPGKGGRVEIRYQDLDDLDRLLDLLLASS